MCSRFLDRAPIGRTLIVGLLLAIALTGCEREKRQFDVPPGTQTDTQAALSSLRIGEIQPGKPIPQATIQNQDEKQAYAVSQGKKLFQAFNCVGCHSNGGGGSGPPLMDDKWIYGSEPIQIYASIAQGRPNGMPSFMGHIPEDQIWQIVAYVRSMSGLVPADVEPARSDALQAFEPEQRREPETPTPAGPAAPH